MEKTIKYEDIELALWRTMAEVLENINKDPEYTVKRIDAINFFRSELGLKKVDKINKGPDPIVWLEDQIASDKKEE